MWASHYNLNQVSLFLTPNADVWKERGGGEESCPGLNWSASPFSCFPFSLSLKRNAHWESWEVTEASWRRVRGRLPGRQEEDNKKWESDWTKSWWLPLVEQSNTAETLPGVILLWCLDVRGYIACEPGSPREGRKQSNSKSYSLDTQANWVPSCFSNTTRKTRSTTLRPWHPSGVMQFTLFVFLSCTAPKLKRLAHLPHPVLSQNTFILRNLLSRNREFTHRSSLLRHL